MDITPILTDPTFITIFASALTVIFGFIAGKYKKKFSQFRQFVDSLDNAMNDPKVSNERFDELYLKGKQLLNEK